MAHDEHDSLQQLGMFDDPTSLKKEKPTPSYFKIGMGFLLLALGSSFGSYLWDAKWAKDDAVELSVENSVATRWGWAPYRLEYELYLDRGFDLNWLETEAMDKTRKTLGDVSPFVELILIRLYGLMNFLLPMLIVFCYAVSLGSIRYYNKRFEFKHVSSTFNNASIKVLFTGLPLTLLWAIIPFGIAIPFLGEIPIMSGMPGVGFVWVSSPLLGASVCGFLFCLVGFVLGSNFSREI